jgi:hypothetical protein
MKIKVLNRTDPNRCNCTGYVRARIPSMPRGLWTLYNKTKMINSQYPAIGNVAVMNTGIWYKLFGRTLVFSGHLGIVTNAQGNLITIKEANFQNCTITQRTGTRQELRIVGYFRPKQKKAKAQPIQSKTTKPQPVYSTRVVYLQKGQTLSFIAQKYLKNPNRWKEIIVSRFGRPVSEMEARKLRIGEKLVLPAK